MIPGITIRSWPAPRKDRATSITSASWSSRRPARSTGRRPARSAVGTVFFGLLCANALFCATTLLLLTALARTVCGEPRRALLCALLYAAGFSVANQQLAGLVDSGEALFLLLVAWLATTDRWRLIPLAAVGGALAKETFVPLSTLFLLTWWWAERAPDRPRWDRLGWTLLGALLGVIVVCALRGWADPWALAAAERAPGGYLQALLGVVAAKGLWYPFYWLLPLGLWRLKALPRPWLAASTAAALGALLLGAWSDDVGGNAGRPLFAILGPILCLSAATLLLEERS